MGNRDRSCESIDLDTARKKKTRKQKKTPHRAVEMEKKQMKRKQNKRVCDTERENKQTE